MVEAQGGSTLAMASHRAAPALLLITSLLVAVALSGADARPAVRPYKAAALRGADDVRRTEGNTKVTVPEPQDDAHGPGYIAGAAAPAVAKPDCEEGGEDEEPETKPGRGDGETGHYPSPDIIEKGHHPDPEDEPGHDEPEQPKDPGTGPASEESELDQELCSTCEEPKKPEPEPPCDTCDEPEQQPEQEPELTCNKVHAVREGETCDSVGQCAGLGQDDFLRFNPNICCEKLFVGQWVCLDATCDA